MGFTSMRKCGASTICFQETHRAFVGRLECLIYRIQVCPRVRIWLGPLFCASFALN